MRSLGRLAVTAAAAVALGGCSNAVPAPEAPTPSPATSANADPGPLDVRGRDACAVLGPEQLDGLLVGRDPVDHVGEGAATSCTWRRTDGSATITLAVNSAFGLELLDLADDSLAVREPLEVAGFPAERIDATDSATCRIAVGIGGSQLVSGQAASLTTAAPPLCDIALSVSRAAVDALRGT